jgi:hypothetical protein
LVQNSVSEFSLWRAVTPIVEGSEFALVLREFLFEDVVEGWLASEPISILSQNYRNPTVGDEIACTIQAGALKGYSALARVFNLFQNFVSFCCSVLPESF